MCLLTTQPKALRAKKDIKVYKLFKDIGDELYSPYQWFKYENIGRQKTISLGVAKNCIGIPFIKSEIDRALRDSAFNNKKINTISKGYHSCKDFDFLLDNREDNTIYECIVPKGAWYYEGYYGLMVSTDLIIKNWNFKFI